MEMEKETCSLQLMAEEERLVIRDIAMTAETLTKEGDPFFLLSLRSISPPFSRILFLYLFIYFLFEESQISLH